MQPPLITMGDGFVLDRWRVRDSDALRRFDLDPEAARFFGWTVEAARDLPDEHYDGPSRERACLEEWKAGNRLNLAIRCQGNGQAVGFVELRPDGATAEVSYMVCAEMRGQELAPRALNAFLDWATEALCLRTAVLTCHVENRASQRVADKCRFTRLAHDGANLQYERQL